MVAVKTRRRYITTVSKQAMSMSNLLRWLPRLTEKQRQDMNLALGCHAPFWNRNKAIEELREASREYRAAYAHIADILEGPPYTPPADQPD
jgi:hypothetical protein